MKKITIASRESKLALWQSNYVKQLLLDLGVACDIITMKTQGDKILDKPLNQIGGKALFMKELEVAIQQQHADIAVHSLKDVPYELPRGFALGAFCQRENPTDAFVSNEFPSIDALPKQAKIGTSSLRRKAQLLAYRPDLQIHDLRGNVQTRLRKLDESQYDGIILASAGLIRLGLSQRITQMLDISLCLPAVGQGIVTIEYLSNNTPIKAILKQLNDQHSQVCAQAERAFNETLQGGCHAPIAAHASLGCNKLITVKAMAANIDGSRMLKLNHGGKDPIEVGQTLAQKMIEQGALKILPS